MHVMGNLSHFTLVLFLFINALTLLNTVMATNAGILNFTQSSGSVTPQGSITFRCEATGDEAEWRINGIPRFSSYGEFTITYLYTPSNIPHWTLSLIVQATLHNNGTVIACFASNSRIIGQHVTQTKTFIIAGPPLPPAPMVVNSNATNLTVMWEEPFTKADFPITGYKLDMVNKTSGIQTVLLDFSSALSYNMSVDEVVSACHELNFSVTAYNELGDATGHAIGMFPKVPEPVHISADLSFAADGTPRLHVISLHREACSYRRAEYIIRIISSEGEVLREARGDQLNERNEFEEQLNSGLIMGQTYTISVVGMSPAGTSTLEEEITIAFDTNQVPCDSQLPDPLNGQVTVTNTPVGSVAVYTCFDRHMLNGNLTRTCLHDGSWSGSAPTCDPQSCDSIPPNIPNGQVMVSNSLVGSVAVYTCSEGYLLNGDPNKTCQLNGTWSGTAPVCIVIHCEPNLPDPLNGQVMVTNTSVGSVAVYTCAEGYVQNGNPNRTCQFNGTWSIPVPTCNQDLQSIIDSYTSMITGVSLGIVAVVVSLFLVIVVTIITCFVCRRNRRKRMSNSVDGRQFTDSVSFPMRQPPKSIKLNKCATNPIYDGGPIYDTPTGETFKSLLGSTPSTPSTPADSPRYFNMPPQLPAPRKASVSAPVHSEVTSPSSPQSTVKEVEKIQESFNAAVPPPPPDDEYTIMNPIQTGRPARYKPSPLVIPNSTMESNGVYVTVN